MTRTICIAGKNMIAVSAMTRLAQDHELVCLPNPDDRGEDGWQPSLRRAALEAGIPTISQREAAAMPELCFLSLEYSEIIRPSEFASDQLFNVHFSLLPKYRGCNTSVWPILLGEDQHGITLHLIDAGVDTGPIIAQRAFPLSGLSAFQAYMACQRIGLDLVIEWVPRLMSGNYDLEPQREGTTFRRKDLDYGLSEIDLRESADEVMRRIRAFTFPAYQMPTLHGREIVGAALVPFEGSAMFEAADVPVYLRFADTPTSPRIREAASACRSAGGRGHA